MSQNGNDNPSNSDWNFGTNGSHHQNGDDLNLNALEFELIALKVYIFIYGNEKK
jgi:hypothetical protein